MRYLLDEALEQGAWGYSTGLEYAAERGAGEDELVSMCEVCGRRHGLYATHTRRRDDGRRRGGRRGAANGRALRRAAPGLAPRAANGIESARRCVELVDAAAAAGHGRGVRHAHAAVRDDVPAHGAAALGARGPVAAARDPRRPGAAAAMRGYESILSAGGDWSRIVLLDNDFWPEYARRDIASIAADRGQDPLDAVYDLLLGAAADPARLMVLIHAYTEEQQREAFAHPLCVPGSTRPRWRPTAHSPVRCFTARTRGRRGTPLLRPGRSRCSGWPKPSTG